MDELHEWITTMIATKDQSDLELHVETSRDGHTFAIPAHSMVLKSSSTLFDKMLEPGKFKEGKTGVPKIHVHGSKADAVLFIKYLYTKKLQTLDTNAYVALLQNAHLYEMTKLLKLCEKRIRIGLTPYTVCGIYSTTQSVSSKAFRDFCKNLMLNFAFLIFGENLHITLSEETMIDLLSSENLNIVDEEQALQAIWHWGQSKCILMAGTKETKEVVASLIPHIRWSTIESLENSSPSFHLLNYYKSIFRLDERMVKNTFSLSCFANFLTLRQNVDCINSPWCDEGFNGKHPLITFISDYTVLLTGVEIHVRSTLESFSKSPFDIYVNTSQIPISSCEYELLYKTNASSASCYYIFNMDFCKPVLLRTKKIHNIFLEGSKINISLQTLNLKTSTLETGILGSDGEVSFSVVGQVTAIQKLFYFMQS